MKILYISTCTECHFCTWSDEWSVDYKAVCTNSKSPQIKISNVCKIPKWCPLEVVK